MRRIGGEVRRCSSYYTRLGIPSPGIYKRKEGIMTFDEWYEEFQKELTKQSGTGVIPKGMEKESYRENYNEGMTPSDRAWQELDDLSR